MLIAGPNLTIDRTLTIDELRPGEVLRFNEVAVTPGGKGVNVARVARALRASSLLVGFVPGHTGQAAARLLADEGVELEAVPVDGEVRSTAVALERSGRVTVMNEPGPPLGAGDWERYERAVVDGLERHIMLACSGSAPPGAPEDCYARLVALARERGAMTLVDANGPSLAAALDARPDVATPNLAEAEGMLLGRADETVEAGDSVEVRQRAAAAAKGLVAHGARAAIVTAGAAGASLLVEGGEPRWHAAPRMEVQNPIGAGDALVGGLCVALERGDPLDRAIALGLATAAASVETAKAGAIDPARVEELAR